MKKNNIVTFLLIYMCLASCFSNAQTKKKIPKEVEIVLTKSGKNRSELEKVIIHYSKNPLDSLKLKAAFFLISNMDIHYTESYNWLDKKGQKVYFNELNYIDFNAALAAFKKLKNNLPGLHSVPVIYNDIDYVNAPFLIGNIDVAFFTWRHSAMKNISFADFCEYILPYRVDTEPLQNWRLVYENKFKWITKISKNKNFDVTLFLVASEFKGWFSFSADRGDEPLPSLGALQLIFRKAGICNDMANLTALVFRSQGIPASVDRVPYWSTSHNGHYYNEVFNSQMTPIEFDGFKKNEDYRDSLTFDGALKREPSKIIRMTYSKQKGTLASFENVKNIPRGFMCDQNYIDVTNKYWPTDNIVCKLFQTSNNSRIAFACIFNYNEWRPTWWGKIKNNYVKFNSMSKGVVYLPALYMNGTVVPAGYLIAKGYHHEATLIPDYYKKRTIEITEEDKYLFFRPGKKYKLYYWDNNWRIIGEKIALSNTHKIYFENVPSNALYILVPEYTEHKERPFTITSEGKRVWW